MNRLRLLLAIVLIICSVNYAGELCAVTLDSIIVEVFEHAGGAFTDAKIPLSDPNRNQFMALSQAGSVCWFTYGGTTGYNWYRSNDYGETISDSVNFNSFLGYPTDHAHFTLRDDTIYCAYPGSGAAVNIGIIDATSGLVLGTARTPTVQAGASVFATRYHPLPTGDSVAILWRSNDPRTYDISNNWTTDLGVTVGSREWVEDLATTSGNGGRLGACWYDNSIMAAVYDRDEYYGVVYYDRAAQSWGAPDTLWQTLLARWYDLQSYKDTVLFAGVSLAAGSEDTVVYAAKRKGDGAWTYGYLGDDLIGDESQSVGFTEVQSSGRMVAFYGHYYASGNLGIRMRWFSPDDSLTCSTAEYDIVGDSITVGGTFRRFAYAAYVPSSHGDVAYLYYSNPANSRYRVVKVTFVPVEAGEENYQPMSIMGGTVSGGTIQ